MAGERGWEKYGGRKWRETESGRNMAGEIGGGNWREKESGRNMSPTNIDTHTSYT